MKSIILYYSRSGNTEKLAKKIKEDTGSDILKIVPEKEYGNYLESCIRVSKEKGSKMTPSFITEIPNLSEYEVVFIGYPVWAQDMPEFLATFINKCDLKDKIVIPFVTFGMTGINWTRKTLDKVCKNAIIALPYQSGVFKKDNYSTWINKVKDLLKGINNE